MYKLKKHKHHWLYVCICCYEILTNEKHKTCYKMLGKAIFSLTFKVYNTSISSEPFKLTEGCLSDFFEDCAAKVSRRKFHGCYRRTGAEELRGSRYSGIVKYGPNITNNLNYSSSESMYITCMKYLVRTK